MKYNKDKVEVAKILFAEILELNQELPEDRFIDIMTRGHKDGWLEVIFWHIDKEGGPDYERRDRFYELLGDVSFRENTFADITTKMQEWKELYCK